MSGSPLSSLPGEPGFHYTHTHDAHDAGVRAHAAAKNEDGEDFSKSKISEVFRDTLLEARQDNLDLLIPTNPKAEVHFLVFL